MVHFLSVRRNKKYMNRLFTDSTALYLFFDEQVRHGMNPFSLSITIIKGTMRKNILSCLLDSLFKLCLAGCLEVLVSTVLHIRVLIWLHVFLCEMCTSFFLFACNKTHAGFDGSFWFDYCIYFLSFLSRSIVTNRCAYLDFLSTEEREREREDADKQENI